MSGMLQVCVLVVGVPDRIWLWVYKIKGCLFKCFFKQIVKESYVDDTQFDKADPHYDP